LLATDAAGNQSTVASEQITVDNGPPAPPTGLSATATKSGGSTFTVRWSDPARQVAPITAATYEVCPQVALVRAVRRIGARAGPASVTVPGAGSWSIAVWLTNAAGNTSPTDAAHVSVVVPAAGPGGSGAQATIHLSETLRGGSLWCV